MEGFTVSNGSIEQVESLSAEEVQDLHQTMAVIRQMDEEEEN